MKLGGWGYREDLGGGEREKRIWSNTLCISFNYEHNLGIAILGAVPKSKLAIVPAPADYVVT